MANYIKAYAESIESGEIVAGKWIKLVYKYITNGIEDGSLIYDEQKANDAIEWIESHCFHTEGPLAPGPLKLELWQKAFVSSIFGLVDENGYRVHREVVLVVSRKQGKSALTAAICKYVWLNGGFGSKVFCVAPKLDQADIIYNNIWQMTLLDPEYQQLKDALSARDAHNKKLLDDGALPRHRQTDLYVPGTNSMVKKIAFTERTNDGFNPSICSCDEFAAWSGDKGLKVYEVMKSGMGARPEALLLSCSTAGYVNDSIYDELMKRSTRFLLGESKEKKLLPFIYMVDEAEKWNDIEELKKSNPNMGVSVSEDYLREEIAVAEGSLSKKAEFLCKYCCVKQNSSLAWLPASTIDKCFSGVPIDLEQFHRCYCVLGIDLSRTTDLSALTLVVEKAGRLYGYAHFWLPGEKIDEASARDGLPYAAFIKKGFLSPSGDNFIDYKDISKLISDIVSKYKMYPLVVGYDRYSSTYLIDELKALGLKTDDVFQGWNLSPVIDELEGIIKDGDIDFGDNDLLKIHLLDSAMKQNTDNGRRQLVKINKNGHIDGSAAMLDAFCVKQKWGAEIGELLKNKKR